MKRLVSSLLCLLLSVFTTALAMKPTHTLAAVAKAAQEKPIEQKADSKTLLEDANMALTAMFDMSEAEEQEVAAEEDTDDEVPSSDDDSMEDASDDEGEDAGNHDVGGDDDSGADDDGADDGD